MTHANNTECIACHKAITPRMTPYAVKVLDGNGKELGTANKCAKCAKHGRDVGPVWVLGVQSIEEVLS